MSLNIYNSFDPLILNSYIKPKNVSNIGFAGSQVGIIAAVGVAALAGGGGGGGSGSSSSSPATLSFSVSASSLGECDSGITITGNLTKAHSSNVNITYSTGGTATSGTDYNLSSSSGFCSLQYSSEGSKQSLSGFILSFIALKISKLRLSQLLLTKQ